MRYLIVGFGNIGHKRKQALGKKCIATVDPNPKALADYSDYKKVPLEDFDVAVLCVPQHLKIEVAKYFLSKGRHVINEKPFIITKPQGRKLAAIAKRNKVIWYTSYNHRFEPNIIKIKNLIYKKTIGKLYHARFIYSFGNIKERIGTWRETLFGVMEEIAPHPIDLIRWFWGYKGSKFKLISARKVESKIFDHWIFATTDEKIFIETNAITWKNVFSIDIYGESGSIHMNGLNKWGKSELIVRKRILPAGIPKEKSIKTSGPDKSWISDFKYFEKLVRNGKSSLENDLETSIAIRNLSKEALNK